MTSDVLFVSKQELCENLDRGLNAIGIVYATNPHAEWTEVRISSSNTSIIVSVSDNQYSLFVSRKILGILNMAKNRLFEFDKYCDPINVRINFWKALINACSQ